MKAKVGIDVSHRTLPNYLYTRSRLGEFVSKRFKVADLAFCQLNEQFIREFQEFVVIEKGLAVETVRHYLAILKKFVELHSRRVIQTNVILNIILYHSRKRDLHEH